MLSKTDYTYSVADSTTGWHLILRNGFQPGAPFANMD